MFVTGKEIIAKEVSPGIFRKILTYNDKLMVCEFLIKKGAVLKEHHHINLQNTYVISGKLEFSVNGETRVVTDGDSILMEEDAPHSVVGLEDTRVIDVFSPMRKDFL
ncbi:MAG: cupin domain-containing protein [Anaerotignaceae bacterium]